MTRRIATAIDIDAPADAIWRVLVDFPAYPEWNPFILRITGEAKVGARLEITAQPAYRECTPSTPRTPGEARVGARLEITPQPANRKPMTFRPTVRVADPGRELRWLGGGPLPRIFHCEHA